MAADIAQGASAKIPPATPLEWKVSGMIRARGRRPQPKVPIQCRRNRWRVFGPLNALRPILIKKAIGRTIGPDMDFAHWANRVVPNELAQAPCVFRSLALVAHLGGDLMLARRFRDLPR